MSAISSFQVGVELANCIGSSARTNIKEEIVNLIENENITSIFVLAATFIRITREQSIVNTQNQNVSSIHSKSNASNSGDHNVIQQNLNLSSIDNSQLFNLSNYGKENLLAVFVPNSIISILADEIKLIQEISNQSNAVNNYMHDSCNQNCVIHLNSKLTEDLKKLSNQIHPVLAKLDIRGIVLAQPLKLESNLCGTEDETAHKNKHAQPLLKETNLYPTSAPAVMNVILYQFPLISKQKLIHHNIKESESTQLNDDLASLNSIITNIDGEVMRGAPEAVIKTFQVSSLQFEEHEQNRSPQIFAQHSNQNYINLSKKSPIETNNMQIPSCPVCLYRIHPTFVGFPPIKDHQLCADDTHHRVLPTIDFNEHNTSPTSFFCTNMNLLIPWSYPSYCSACIIIDNYNSSQRDIVYNSVPTVSNSFHNTANHGLQFSSNLSSTSNLSSAIQTQKCFKKPCCYECGMKETLWVCLICGTVGCSRHSQFHAGKHFHETGHRFSLELVTQRIWDYAADSFVQRNDILACQSQLSTYYSQFDRNTSNHRNITTQQCSANQHNPFNSSNLLESCHTHSSYLTQYHQSHFNPPKKTIMISEEYEALIHSALEDQAHYFEGEITRLRAELAGQQVIQEGDKSTDEETQEIEELRKYIENLRSNIDCLSQELVKDQALEARLRLNSHRLLRDQAGSQELLKQLQEDASKMHEEGKFQIEELEQQIQDLTANLRMMKQIAQNEELNNAQIFGTASKAPKRGKKSRRSRK